MTCTADHFDFADGAGANSVAPRRGSSASGLIKRIRGAFFGWAGGVDDAIAAAFIARSGGRLTDSLEREMFERRTMSNWNVGD